MNKQLQSTYSLTVGCVSDISVAGSLQMNKDIWGWQTLLEWVFLFCQFGKVVMLQMWLTVNFLLCVLCFQALAVAASVRTVPVSGVCWSSGRHAGTITPLDHREAGGY